MTGTPNNSKGSMGFSSYHSALGQALRRRAVQYLSEWTTEKDDILEPDYEYMPGERMVLALLIAAYIEALINLLLSLNLGSDKIPNLKKESLLDKWSEGPKVFIPSWDLSRDPKLLEDFKSLIKRRHQIVHMRPNVSFEGKQEHVGNPYFTTGEDHAQTLAWLSVPCRLADSLQTASPLIGHRFRFHSRVDILRDFAGVANTPPDQKT